MKLIPLLSCHLEDMALQPGQGEMAEYLDTDGYTVLLESLTNSYSVMSDDGVFLACGGLADQGNGRALAWTLFSTRVEGCAMMREITELTCQVLGGSGYRRIEAIVKDGFKPGHKWMKMLGFKCETDNGMMAYFKDGTAGFLYARSGL